MSVFYKIFLLVLIPVLIMTANTSHAEDTVPRPTIAVSGSAEVRVVPDHAILTFSISSRAKELAASVADNDTRVSSVLQFLGESKIEEKFIRTELLRIKPIFDDRSKQGWSAPVQTNVALPAPAEPSIDPIGYTAVRQLSITVNELESFETIYRGLVERGVNEVGGLTFHSSELRKHRDEARLQAVRAAREKATAMAAELGCTLAAVESIRESSGHRYQSALQNSISYAPTGSGSVAMGMIDIEATVDVVFVLGDVDLSK